ncbi:MAG: hypothetical protein IJ594_08885 [Oscillospiraceae bacterium]|nr:hypothetical protein [Oscillospiraceae bacterium]
MKTTRADKWICVLFCTFLACVFLLLLLLPEKDFSENEKRYLTQAPALSGESVLSGRFADQAERWAADHLPGRDFFVGLNAQYDLLAGRQVTKEIYRGRSGRLYEAPAALDETQIERNLAAINALAATVGREVDLMLVPGAGAVLQEDLPRFTDPYRDGEILRAAYAEASDGVRPVDLWERFCGAADREALYYRTDHHWTARGAWLACGEYLRAKGREALPESAYAVTAVPGFYGTTYTRSALWSTPPESVELWDSGGRFTVENADGGAPHAGLFYEERLAESDKYPVYLDGNHSLLRIRSASGGAGRILVVRDSFASCFACFLADSYEEVVLVDLRYYRSPVSELLAQEEFDDVLVLYGVNNFMSDANLMRLE